MSNNPKIVCYEWQAGDNFLFPILFPECKRLEAKPDDWGEDVLKQLPDSTCVFVFHLNLTHTAGIPHHRASFCRSLASRGITVLNGEATNISKAFVQATCRRQGLPSTEAEMDGDADELLILKTNLNYGGLGEASLTPSSLKMLGFCDNPGMDAKSYEICARGDIAESRWKDLSLFVERFVTNQEGRFYRAYWLRSNLVISEVVDPLPIKKMPEGIERKNCFFRNTDAGIISTGETSESTAALADQLYGFIEAARIDFGATDIVVDDSGQHFIIDINTTPSWRDTTAPDVVEHLRAGLLA